MSYTKQQQINIMTDTNENTPVVRLPSFKRGCKAKVILGRSYEKQAEKMKAKHGKEYGVYHCPYCDGTHLTTKLQNSHKYPPLVYQTNSTISKH